MSRLLTSGRRDMTEEELKQEKANGGKRKTVDILFGDTAMTYIYEKVAEILTGIAKEDLTGLRATEWGEMHESDALELYGEVTGKDFIYHGCDNPKFYPYNAYSGASPDAKGNDFTVESKCPFVTSNHIGYLIASKAGDHSQWLKENHLDYYVQCQFVMMACKTEKHDFISYDPRMSRKENRLAILNILPDVKLQKDIDHRLAEAGKIVKAVLDMLGNPAASNTTLLATKIPEGILIDKA